MIRFVAPTSRHDKHHLIVLRLCLVCALQNYFWPQICLRYCLLRVSASIENLQFAISHRKWKRKFASDWRLDRLNAAAAVEGFEVEKMNRFGMYVLRILGILPPHREWEREKGRWGGVGRESKEPASQQTSYHFHCIYYYRNCSHSRKTNQPSTHRPTNTHKQNTAVQVKFVGNSLIPRYLVSNVSCNPEC